MIETFLVDYPLLEGNSEKRKAYVYLPVGYEESNERYPVLYMFDGHNVFFDEDATFGKSWGIDKYLDAHNIPMIVAAVECNHDENNGRLKEYSPYDFTYKKIGFIKGGGQETMDWYIDVFKKMIDENYRSKPEREYCYIGGSSMGGLMSFYALLEYNDVYSKAVALSPSLWLVQNEISEQIKKSKVKKDTVLYMGYGAKEFGNYQRIREHFGEVCSSLIAKKINLTCHIDPLGTHCEASWEKQIPYFISLLQQES